MWWRPGLLPRANVRRGRSIVLVVALAATALKLWIAATTFGTNDVTSWIDFAKGVREFGWVDVYGGREYFSQYNHPPMSGVLLVAVNWIADLGVADVPFLIRVPASIADTVTALLVFELVRSERPVRQAAAAGVLVGISHLQAERPSHNASLTSN